jgi:hypothetical protein
MAPEAPYPLYNTTFTLHRVSPLYTGPDRRLDHAALQQHAKCFRDLLAGDVLRGVRVGGGPGEEVLARVGALRSVIWQVLVEEDAWRGDEETRGEVAAGRGILVRVCYEKTEYRAILLRGRGADAVVEQMGFQHFPLLLTRMPAALRATFTEFLATTFDARVAGLPLSSACLATTLARYMSDCGVGEDGTPVDLVESSRTLRNAVQDVQVLIGFDLPAMHSLQTIEFHLAAEDIPRLVLLGRKLGDAESPFMDALSIFTQAHLALDIKHEKVRISRIACGAFVLGAEGRVKLTEPTGSDAVQLRGTRNLVDGLVGIATGGTMLGSKGTT